MARVTLHNMRQDRDEPVHAFVARRRGQASVCKFAQQCSRCDANVDYTESIIKDVLCRGLEDGETQRDLLGDKNHDTTLEEVIGFVEAKEARRRSASRLLFPQSTDTVNSSTYRKQKKTPLKDTSKEQDVCSYCETKGHGRNPPTRVRRRECPPFGKKCNRCNKDQHFERVYRSKNNTKSTDEAEQDAIFDAVCEVMLTGSPAATLNHHIYNKVTKPWLRRQSRSQPYVRLQASIRQEDYDHLHVPMGVPQGQAFVSAMADTGCQSYLASLKIVKKSGLSTTNLIPVDFKMYAANDTNIRILGAAILRLSGKDKDGKEHSTRQMVYVTDCTDKLFLSREACTDLGIIPGTFPTIGGARETTSINAASNTDYTSTNRECSCPPRSKPPPIPTSLPFPATEDNREKLQQYLLDYYKSSTFNTCEHQPLSLRDSPPMRLIIDPNATATAHHSPIPVPLHWQDAVKTGLDRDVRLGVLEPVPIGQPVTWLHHMVICAKKDGTPRRTIDFQPLNFHATRETHHTQHPFHQARSIPNGKKKTVFDA